MAKAQQEPQFAEVTPVSAVHVGSAVAATVHVGETVVEVYNGADASTLEAVLRLIKPC